MAERAAGTGRRKRLRPGGSRTCNPCRARSRTGFISRCGLLVLLAIASPAFGQQAEAGETRQISTLSADALLDFANQALEAGNAQLAERVYRALFDDPSVAIRSEARFRLAMMFAGRDRLSEAALLLRHILDEQPHAQRVRLELARLLDRMGDDRGARKMLREAQAGRLPEEVARFVDRYSAALRQRKPIGASIDIALAPDSNINRATRSETLGTIFGDFIIDEESRSRSGIGLALRGQAYARQPIGERANLLGRVSALADLYRDSDFNDLALGISAGPEIRRGADRISIEGGGLWRWFGGNLHSRSATFSVNYLHPIGRTAQLRATFGLGLVDNRLNDLQDGQSYSASLGFDQALSSRAGIGIGLAVDRQALRDPAFSSWGGLATLFGYREAGPVTLVAALGHGRLEADARLPLFPKARSDRLFRASLGATFRNMRIGTFAPFIRTTFERNRSTVAFHDFRKIRTEFGIGRAF